MSKLNERLTLFANLSVVVGIVFLGAEMRLNTQAIQAQTRDSITEKQMTYSEWIATNPETADVFARGNEGVSALAPGQEESMYSLLVQGIYREWENSLYQYERGLFTGEEFEPRVAIWEGFLALQGARDIWAARRHTFAPSFRDEIDRLVAQIERSS